MDNQTLYKPLDDFDNQIYMLILNKNDKQK